MNTDILIKNIIKGDKLSVSRAISMIENNVPDADKLLDGIHKYVGKALRIGVTGPPGVGKSTIVNELISALRKQDKQVGIIAVDPSSMFSGGAILGDRIRMSTCRRDSTSDGQKIGVDNGVFIRSMATRGCSGGLSRATVETADVIEASGKDYIIIETVGVGQSEVEIFRSVDAVVLVLSPESGDAIQAMKAGIMEIADVIMVNKADRPGLDAFVTNLRNTLELGSKAAIPVLTAQANAGIGVTELLDTLDRYLAGLKDSGKLAQRRRDVLRERIKSHILNRLEEEFINHPKITKLLDSEIKKIIGGKETPYKVAEKALRLLRLRSQ